MLGVIGVSSAKQIVSSFIKKINDEYVTETATEHSYRPAIKELLEALLPNFKAQNEPKRCEAGAPDFIIADSCGVAQAYVEAPS